MKKSLLSTLMACTVTLSALATPAVVSADEFDNKIADKDAKISNLNEQQVDTQGQINTLESEVAGINEKSQDLLNEQETLRQKSQDLQKEIQALQERIEKRSEAIKEQAREVQVKQSKTNIIDVVLNAESFSDAVGRVQAMTTIVKANNDLVKQQKADKDAVEQKEAENQQRLGEIATNQSALEEQKGELVTKQADLDVQKATLAVEKAATEDEKADLQQKKQAAEEEQARVQEQNRIVEEYQKQVAQENAANNAATGSTEQALPQATTPTLPPVADQEETPAAPLPAAPSVVPGGNTNNTPAQEAPAQKPQTPAPAPSANGSAIVAEALKYIGKPYVWGANGPDAFDCSGLVRYVYTTVGGYDPATFPRVTTGQETLGTQISIYDAQPGDLLFWGSRGGTYHVAIAMGGGKYVHAPAPGQTVTDGKFQWFMPDFAVRM